MKTVVYKVRMDTANAKKGGRDMQITMRSMETDSKKTKQSMEDLAKTIAKDYNVQAKVFVDNTKSAKSALQQASREANKNERAIARLKTEYAAMTAGLGKGADEQQILNAQMRLGANATKQQKDEIRKLITMYQLQRNEVNKTGKSMRNFRGQMSNVGFQMQDIAVQAQMGTNAFVILGQQGSQLAASLGPSGPLIGAGIALGAMLGSLLFPQLMKSKKAMEEVNDEIMRLAKSTGLSRSAVTLAIMRERELIRENEKKLVLKRKEFKENFAVSKSYEEYTKRALESAQAFNKGNGSISTTVIKTKKEFEEANRNAIKQTFELQEEILKLEKAVKSSEKNIKTYGRAMGDVGVDKQDEWLKSNSQLIASLKREADQIGKNSVELLKMEKAEKLLLLTNQNATNEQKERVKVLYETLIAEAQRVETTKQQLAESRKQAKQEAEALKAREKADREAKKSLSERIALLRRQDAIKARLGIDELQRLENQYKSERALLEGHLEAQKALDSEYERNKRKVQASGLELYMLSVEDQLKDFDNLASESLNNFTKGFGKAVGDAVFESENLGDAMSSVFKGALQNMVSFFAEWAAQELVLWTLKQFLGTSAQTAAATTATANAEAMSIMAGLNAFASTAAIPIVGPPAAPAAAGAALAITQPMAAAASAASFAGVFDEGGRIPQGSMGIISEYGDELLNGMLVKGQPGGSRVTGREETARLMSGKGDTNYFNITGSENASAEQIANTLVRKLRKGRGTKSLDDAIYDSMERGRRNRGKRYVS